MPRAFLVGACLLLCSVVSACGDNPLEDLPGSRATGTIQASSHDYVLPLIVAIGTPSTCDPWTDLNWCSGGGAGECMTDTGTSPETAILLACGTQGGGGELGGGGDDGGVSAAETTYHQGPLLWGACVLAVAGSTYSISQVAGEFQAWYDAYQAAASAQRTWQMTIENGADPVVQQLYEYQYKQALQRQEAAKGVVSSAANTSYWALAGAALACGATALIPSP